MTLENLTNANKTKFLLQSKKFQLDKNKIQQ